MERRAWSGKYNTSYKKFMGIQNILEEVLPDRKYDLTEAICEGVKEMGQVKKKKAFRNMQKLGQFLHEL